MDSFPFQTRLPVLKITQPIGEFYLGSVSSDFLIEISSSDIRRLKDNELDQYMGIQRRLDGSRVKEISGYVNSFDATFPTGVLLAVSDANAMYDEETRELVLLSTGVEGKFGEIATIIDGQHRIEGLKNFKGPTFDVPVSFFIGADQHTQATIFATVNLAQTKVNRSLAYDLLDYEKLESPQKVAHWVAVSLDKMEKSPFKGRIKRLGVATEGRQRETLTQATVVELLVDLFLSSSVTRDRNSLWNKVSRSNLPSEEVLRYPFRKLYTNGSDEQILANIVNFFLAVATEYPDSWNAVNRKGNILPKTNGFRALMRVLQKLYPLLAERTQRATLFSTDYKDFFQHVTLKDGDFTTELFPAGTSGESRLFEHLKIGFERYLKMLKSQT